MKSLSESYINVCNAFFVVFSSKISLTLMKLCNCMFTCWNQHWKVKSSASKLYLCFFMNWNIQKRHLLKVEEWEMSWLVSIRCACMILHAHWVSRVLSSIQLRSVVWFCSLFKWTWSEDVYVSTFNILMFTFWKMFITWYSAWFWRASSHHSVLNNFSSLSRWCHIDASNIIFDLTTAEYICLVFANVVS